MYRCFCRKENRKLKKQKKVQEELFEKTKAEQEEKRKQEERIGYKGISNDKIDSLESTLKTLKEYDKKTGQSLRYAIERIKRVGSTDYDYFKAQVFRENFMKALDNVKNFDNYKVLNTQAPYVVDKLTLYKHDLWNEVMTFLGVNNANQDKKERLMTEKCHKSFVIYTFRIPPRPTCRIFRFQGVRCGLLPKRK